MASGFDVHETLDAVAQKQTLGVGALEAKTDLRQPRD
jgi:hypothetical protein